MNDHLSDRMKQWEDNYRLPKSDDIVVVARLDGRNFSAWVKRKGFDKPFDAGLANLMVSTTQYLAEEFNAETAYTQSDEISLIWESNKAPFDGRSQKITSVLASACAVFFNTLASIGGNPKYWTTNDPPLFDCRVFWLPKNEVYGYLTWRYQDAGRNSISMAARSEFPHKSLQGKTGKQMQEMLFEKGINWNDYPVHFKRGTWIERQVISRKFTKDELDRLPPKHEARSNPDLVVERTRYFKTNGSRWLRL